MEVPVRKEDKVATGEGPCAMHHTRLMTELLCIIKMEFRAPIDNLRFVRLGMPTVH